MTSRGRGADGGGPVRITRNGTLLAQTPGAIRVRLDDGSERWIPKSCVHEDSELYGVDVQGSEQRIGAHGDVVVKAWWAEKNELVAC